MVFGSAVLHLDGVAAVGVLLAVNRDLMLLMSRAFSDILVCES